MPYYPPRPKSNVVSTEIDFGHAGGGEGTDASVTVTGQSWVTPESQIACFLQLTGLDHDPDDAIVENIVAYVTNLVAGVGFDVVAVATQSSWGRYTVKAVECPSS